MAQQTKMKVIVAGSRSFNDYEKLCKVCDFMLQNQNESEIQIVTGKANGADKLGEDYGKERGYRIKEFPAPWNNIKDKPEHEIGTRKDGTKYWKLAGHFRNKQMAEYADALIAFWDGASKGTKHMIELAKENMPTKIVKF